MKHLAQIQAEFLKQAADFNQLSLEDQQGYLKKKDKDLGTVKAELESKGKLDNPPIDYMQ